MDDSTTQAERADRVLMDILYGLPRESVEQVSPQSLRLKYWLKLPLLIFVTAAAMTSSISELFMKVIGCILKDAEESSDYLWLLLFIPGLAYTGSRTMVYVNYGIKYYDQMEVMPIYQTCLLLHNISVGMVCLNELRYYTAYMLMGIAFSTMVSALGISILLHKNKEKRTAVMSSLLEEQDRDDSCSQGSGCGGGAVRKSQWAQFASFGEQSTSEGLDDSSTLFLPLNSSNREIAE